jgi:hypothetical protein
MTMIATFAVEKIPVIMGDLLLSSLYNDKLIQIPTVGDTSNFESKGCKISGLRQKVHIINDHLALAWAGSAIGCKMVIRELTEETRKHHFTYDDLRIFFRDIGPDLRPFEVALVGCIYEDEKGFRGFGVNNPIHFQSDVFGDVLIAGSGCFDFQRLVEQFNILPSSVGRQPNPLEVAVMLSFTAMGTLLQEELLASISLNSLYGAGYEIASFVKKKFQKVGNFSSLFWRLRIDGKKLGLSKIPEKVLKVDYLDELLLIRSITFGDLNNDNTMSILRNELFIVHPLFGDENKHDPHSISPLDLNSQFIANHVIVTDMKQRVSLFHKIDYIGSTDPGILFRESNGNISLSCKPAYIWELVNYALESLKQDPMWADLRDRSLSLTGNENFWKPSDIH